MKRIIPSIAAAGITTTQRFTFLEKKSEHHPDNQSDHALKASLCFFACAARTQYSCMNVDIKVI